VSKISGQQRTKGLRLLLINDQALVRAGIRSLLNQLPGVEVVAEAGDWQQALEMVSCHKPDVALLDITQAGRNNIRTAQRLRKEHPGLRLIILSSHENEDYLRSAFRSGASGYLLKKAAVEELQEALRVVGSGRFYLSRALARSFHVKELTAGPRRLPVAGELNSRQREILRLIAESRTTKEIAVELGLSAKTVEFHRAKLMKTLGIFDVPGLVRYAIKVGLAEPEA